MTKEEQEEAQEPFAYAIQSSVHIEFETERQKAMDYIGGIVTPLYTKPQPFKRLSDDEIIALAGNSMRSGFLRYEKFAEAIQDAIQEKNN